jgi:hypothetical protein
MPVLHTVCFADADRLISELKRIKIKGCNTQVNTEIVYRKSTNSLRVILAHSSQSLSQSASENLLDATFDKVGGAVSFLARAES